LLPTDSSWRRLADMKRYGQFCPVAKAAEILAERWTLLILRELLLGSHRYNDLQRGVPRISPTVLTQRLKELQVHGIVQREIAEDGHSHLYSLTTPGQELWPLIELAGNWGQRHRYRHPR
jgi:DNA-binding HxlR family transcriptional regulator